jgi:hypothetical protein
MDYPGMVVQQQDNAAAELGVTKAARARGQENLHWPNLTGSFATAVIDYWTREAANVQGHIASIPDSAIRTQWLRAVEILRSQRAPAAAAPPHALLSESHTALVWTSVDGVALPLRGLADTPTKWDFVVESVAEAVAEVGSSTRTILSLVALALVAAVLYKWSA